jgi:CheY-like chemotaxis protein
VFTVEFPAHVPVESAGSAELSQESDAAAAEEDACVGASTVLVIDDDPAVRDLMTRFLGKIGYRTVLAASGPEGLRLAHRIRPDVITLDVVMPGMNGWDVLSHLKADPELSPIPVIMLTIVDHEALGVARGASNYLVKPIDRDRLAVTLAKYRDRSDRPDLEMTQA